MEDDFEVFAEWVIRRLREIDFEKADKDTIIRWILYSLGVKDIGAKIYLYLRDKKKVTTTEIADVFGISPATARKYLEQLHALGIVDYIGREYHLTRDDLSGCIREIFIPRIKKVLDHISKIAEIVDEKERSIPGATELTGSIDEFRKAIQEAKEKALSDITIMMKEGVELTPKIITSVITNIFDALSKTLEKVKHPAITTVVLGNRKPRVKGISIVERQDRIYYSIYSDYSISKKELEEALNSGKKILIRVYGTLKIPADTPKHLAEVIDGLYVYGKVVGPKDFIENINNLVVYGAIEYL